LFQRQVNAQNQKRLKYKIKLLKDNFRLRRLSVPFGVPYGSDPGEVVQLAEAAKNPVYAWKR